MGGRGEDRTGPLPPPASRAVCSTLPCHCPTPWSVTNKVIQGRGEEEGLWRGRRSSCWSRGWGRSWPLPHLTDIPLPNSISLAGMNHLALPSAQSGAETGPTSPRTLQKPPCLQLKEPQHVLSCVGKRLCRRSKPPGAPRKDTSRSAPAPGRSSSGVKTVCRGCSGCPMWASPKGRTLFSPAAFHPLLRAGRRADTAPGPSSTCGRTLQAFKALSGERRKAG